MHTPRVLILVCESSAPQQASSAHSCRGASIAVGWSGDRQTLSTAVSDTTHTGEQPLWPSRRYSVHTVILHTSAWLHRSKHNLNIERRHIVQCGILSAAVTTLRHCTLCGQISVAWLVGSQTAGSQSKVINCLSTSATV